MLTMAEDEYECLISKEEREKTLGFAPQKETVINSLLPYAAQLDDESSRFFAQIKTNFGKAVMLREMKPGCGVWTARLMKYLSIYGLKFSKEDHITLVKLVYELMTIPDLEPNKLHKFFTLFLMLTKKTYLLSPEDLQLPWRPLFELGRVLFDKSRTRIGMFHYHSSKREKELEEDSEGIIKKIVKEFISGTGLDDTLFGSSTGSVLPTSLEVSYSTTVKYAKPYFPLSATKEIVAECLPQLIPWSHDSQVLTQLVMFLPVTLPPNQEGGHQLWFPQLLDFWEKCHNTRCCVLELLNLFSSLAKRSPGAVVWSDYIPQMFSRFMHAVNLPVSYKEMQYNKSHLLEVRSIATWIVWTITPDGHVLKHLRIYLSGLSSYFHSANAGRWSFKLRDFLRKISREFLGRLRREREKNYVDSWMNNVPEENKLRESDITEFVEIILESTLLALNSRAEITATLHNLALLRPALVIPPLLDKLRESLETVTEPHKLTTALQAVSSVARPMLCGSSNGYPEGPTQVIPFLIASLPGLDTNDIKKSLCTLQFILIFSWMVPYIDCSNAAEYHNDLTEEEKLTCETTAQFEDFVILYLERVFNIIDSSIQEHALPEVGQPDVLKSKFESVMETALFTSTSAVMTQSSPKIFSEALRKFKQFALSANYEINVAGSMVGVIVKVFTRVNPEATLAAFVPQLCDEINNILAVDEELVEENPSRELLYRLQLLSHVVDCNGVALAKHVPKIMTVLDRALKQHSKEGIGRACAVLQYIFMSLSSIEIVDYKSVKKDYGSAPKDWLPIREWGRGCKLKDAQFEWHIPTKEDVECCQMLVNRYIKPEMVRWDQWMNGERPMCAKRRLRSLWILLCGLKSCSLMPQPEEEAIKLVETVVPATSFPLASAVKHHLTLDGGNLRAGFVKFLRRIQTKLLQDESDDTRCIEVLVQLWECASGVRYSRSGPGLECRMRSYASLQRCLDGRGGQASRGRLRTLLADALLIQEEARYDLQSEAGITDNGVVILNALFELSVSTYASARRLSQCRLSWMLSHYAYSYRVVIPLLKDLFEKGGEGEEWHGRHKGALYIMFGPKCAPLVTKPDWEVLKILWPMILDAPLHSEKPSILKLEQYFLDTVHRQCSTINTVLTLPDNCVETARALVPELLADPTFVEQLNNAKQVEHQVSMKNVENYKELLESLVKIANSPNIIWRRLELVMMMFNYCPSLQTPYSPSVVRLVTDSLIHDDIQVRRISIKLLQFIMKQRKVKSNVKLMDPYVVAGVPKPDVVKPGYRPDNEWLLWNDNVPTTDEEWEKPFLRNFQVGFYGWPQQIEVAAPSYEQDFLKRTPDDMEEGERYIYDKLMDDQFLGKWVKFLTTEDKKGKDKFSGLRFSTFRILFRNFGYPIASRFLKHAKSHAIDNQDSAHRFVAEVIAASIRATRYWNLQNTNIMYDDALEVLKISLHQITPESLEDWGTAIACSVDNMESRRVGRIVRALLEEGAPPPSPALDADDNSQRSFGVCARLFALQGALSLLSWRGVNLCKMLLNQLEDAKFIHHPYQNVRETVGSILMSIFDTELTFEGCTSSAPKFADFLERMKPKLAVMIDEYGEIVIRSSASMSSISCSSSELRALSVGPQPTSVSIGVETMDMGALQDEAQGQEENEVNNKTLTPITDGDKTFSELPTGLQLESDAPTSGPIEHARAINLLTTVLRSAIGLLIRGVNTHIRTQYQLVRTACALSARGPPSLHDELARAADGFLAALAIAEHTEQDFDEALTTLEDVATSRSWWARLACVDFAQPLLFYSLPYLKQDASRAIRAENLALRLMKDPRLEVRRASGKLFTGLMHCRALANEGHTIDKLMRNCESKNNIERHCGVLGLCSYLTSRPYSVGPKTGLVLAELSKHTNAPAPVPSAIIAALSDFRRTHQDDWPKHREALTEVELDLLADLASPPSYCA